MYLWLWLWAVAMAIQRMKKSRKLHVIWGFLSKQTLVVLNTSRLLFAQRLNMINFFKSQVYYTENGELLFCQSTC